MRIATLPMCLLALFLTVAPLSQAASPYSPDDAKALTLQAVALIEDEGLERARTILHDDSAFRHDELYVNVIDTSGTWRVYPPMPSGEGHNVLDVQDATGKFLVRDIIRVATEKGEGWVEYRWLNPATREVGPKVSYVKRVPGTDLIAYAGIYR